MYDATADRLDAYGDEIVLSRDDRTWGMFCHLAGLAGYIVPLGWLIGPLVVWLLKREDYAFVDDQGRESLNFQLTMFILGLLCIPLVFIFIGLILLLALTVFQVIFTVVAAVKANEGVWYRYPINFRLIK